MSRADRELRGLSLEHKLPLLMTLLLVVTMAAALALGYSEVYRAAVENSRSRLDRVVADLAGLLAPGTANRLTILRGAAESPEILTYLRTREPSAREGARLALEQLIPPAQQGARLLLLDSQRLPILEADSSIPEPGAGAPLPQLRSLGHGQLFLFRDSVHYWTTVPIGREEDPAGYVAELRRLAGGPAGNTFENLVGPAVTVVFGNRTGEGPWVRFSGETLPPPAGASFLGHARFVAPDGEEVFASSASVPSTPWLVIAYEEADQVLGRPAAFLRYSLVAGLLLCLLGGAASWLLSRRITRPIRLLREASEAIAEGDYSRRIDLPRRDELGILAEAYNRMAGRIEASHAELTAQYETAQALARELDRASRAKSDFLATMSHEIRTPINAIIGYTELLMLELDGPLTQEQHAQLERIRLSGRHLVSLVDQVLDLARIESGSLRVDVERASALDAISTAVTVLRPQAEEKSIRITMECDPEEELWYLGDSQKANQILVNLLSNAVKFTPERGLVTVQGRSRVGGPAAIGSGRWISISVRDNGVGIAEEELKHIFDAFIQVDRGYTRRHGGAGLGLTISQRLADSMGGSITVESRPGEGSTFTLWLPAVGSERSEETTSSATGQSAPESVG